MNRDRVMLLIDADNVSLDVIEQALPWVAQHYGGPHVRRAYCTAESAVKHQAAFKRLGIRPMVNLAAGKNSTDIALAVDAIDLACSERPEVVVIASSDSDFAPLVSRLREKGCRVVGVGQAGKVGDETREVYDDFEVLTHRPAAGRARAVQAREDQADGARSSGRPSGRSSGRTSRARPQDQASPQAPAPMAAPLPEPTPSRGRRASGGGKPRKEAASAPPAPSRPPKVQAIVDALPALAGGERVELRVAAERLRDAGVLSNRGSSTRLFGQFADWFELLPPSQPNHVRMRVPPGA